MGDDYLIDGTAIMRAGLERIVSAYDAISATAYDPASHTVSIPSDAANRLFSAITDAKSDFPRLRAVERIWRDEARRLDTRLQRSFVEMQALRAQVEAMREARDRATLELAALLRCAVVPPEASPALAAWVALAKSTGGEADGRA